MTAEDLEFLLQTENRIIDEYVYLTEEIANPHIKTEFQNIISTHRNNINKLLNLSGGKNE